MLVVFAICPVILTSLLGCPRFFFSFLYFSISLFRITVCSTHSLYVYSHVLCSSYYTMIYFSFPAVAVQAMLPNYLFQCSSSSRDIATLPSIFSTDKMNSGDKDAFGCSTISSIQLCIRPLPVGKD
eukprot:scpid38216/ scgid10837/ 